MLSLINVTADNHLSLEEYLSISRQQNNFSIVSKPLKKKSWHIYPDDFLWGCNMIWLGVVKGGKTSKAIVIFVTFSKIFKIKKIIVCALVFRALVSFLFWFIIWFLSETPFFTLLNSVDALSIHSLVKVRNDHPFFVSVTYIFQYCQTLLLFINVFLTFNSMMLLTAKAKKNIDFTFLFFPFLRN